MPDQKYFSCTCGCGVLLLERDEDDGYLELAYLHRIPSHGLVWRLRQAWAGLRGKPYADMVMLDQEEVANLTDYLIKIQNK